MVELHLNPCYGRQIWTVRKPGGTNHIKFSKAGADVSTVIRSGLRSLRFGKGGINKKGIP